VLDAGVGTHEGHAVSFYPRGHSLGVVLPNNSPGVHSLWVPAIGLKTPLVLKPGSSEPWTPYRIAQAFIKAGCPPSAFSLYPADHAGGAEILRHAGRGMFFGDAAAARRFSSDPRIEIHGPGYSKVVLGPDAVDRWAEYADIVVASIADNGGRSCVNASGVWVTGRAEEIAHGLAKRLVRHRAARRRRRGRAARAVRRPLGAAAHLRHDRRRPRRARRRRRDGSVPQGPRVVTTADGTYLLPTLVLCSDSDHPLANREFLFPFASVVPVSADALPDVLGRTLVVSAITGDERLRQRLLASAHVDRLNVGPIATNRIGWDQPHEGNLFDHLYGRRAIQEAALA
jgi:acyl-CoA reductase-like NAD-dependent aldehyde dehydrogenase